MLLLDPEFNKNIAQLIYINIHMQSLSFLRQLDLINFNPKTKSETL